MKAKEYLANKEVNIAGFINKFKSLQPGPLSEEEIENYLSNEVWLDYLKANSGIHSLAHHPSFLNWIKEYLSKHPVPTNLASMYEYLFQNWFKYEQSELVKAGLLKDDSDNFIEHCWIYTYAVALKLKETKTVYINLEAEFADESFFASWQRFFSSNSQTQLIAQCCPWHVSNDSQLGFYHQNFIDYFAGLAKYDLKNYLHLPFIHGDEGIEQLSQLLDREVFAVDSNQLNHLVADVITGDILKEDYFRLVYLSAKTGIFARIAANAITVLNAARLPFSGMDLVGIKIPEANLSRAIFHKTNLSYAKLHNVSFVDSYLADANLSCSEMRGVKFGEQKYLQHKSTIICCAYSLDGYWLATSSEDRTILLWDWQTGRCIQVFQGHTDWVNSISFSRNGKLLVSGSNDQTIRLWDTLSGNTQLIVRESKGVVKSVSFYDETLFAFCGEDQAIRLWNVASKKLQLTLTGHIGWVKTVSFSADGKFLASGGQDTIVRLWDLTSERTQMMMLKGHVRSVNCVSFSADGKFLASGSSDATVRVWKLQDGMLSHVLHEHTNEVLSVNFHKDGELLASGGLDNTVIIWNALDAKVQNKLRGHTWHVCSVNFSKDGKFLASGGRDRTVRLWNMTGTAPMKSSVQGHKASVVSLSISRDGRLLASGSNDKAIHIWNISSGETLFTLQIHNGHVSSICFSEDGNFLASGSDDETIRIWDISTGKTCHVLKGHIGGVRSVCFSTDGKLLASGGNDESIRLWNALNGETQNILKKNGTGWVNSLCFSKDGKFLVSGSSDGVVRIWEVVNRIVKYSLSLHSNEVNTVSFSEDGMLLASAGWDKIIRIWVMSSKTAGYVLKGHTESVNSVSFSKDGKFLASGSSDKSVRIWDVKTGVCIYTLWLDQAVWSVAFHPSGYLITGQSDGTLKYWQILTVKSQELQWQLMRSSPSQQALLIQGAQLKGIADLSFSNECLLKQRGAIGHVNSNPSIDIEEELVQLLQNNAITKARNILMEYPTILIQSFKQGQTLFSLACTQGTNEWLNLLLEQSSIFIKWFFTEPSENWNIEMLKALLVGLNLLRQLKWEAIATSYQIMFSSI